MLPSLKKWFTPHLFSDAFFLKIRRAFLSLKGAGFEQHKLRPKKEKQNQRGKLPSIRQIKYIGQLLSSQEKKTITILLIIIFVCLVFLSGRLYFAHSKIIPKFGGEYREGLIGNPKFINPVLAVDDLDLSLNHLVFSSLLKYDTNFNLVPDLVEEFSLESDQQKQVFCLKENIYWHDGKKLELDDVLFTFSLIQNNRFKNPLLERIKNAQINQIDENCFEISLEKPSLSFWSALTLGIIPKHIWQDLEQEKFVQSEYNLKPIGSGPFKFVSLGKDESGQIRFYSLEANKEYYNPGPLIKQISFHFYDDFTQATQGLKAGEVNGLICSPKQMQEKLFEIKNLKYYQLNFPYYTGIFFNLRLPAQAGLPEEEETNFLREKSVRQTLAHLTSKQNIFTQTLNQQGLIINGPILPYSVFFNPDIKKYDYNPESAEEVLATAGWRKNAQGFYEKNKKVLEISLTTVNQEDFVDIAHLIQKSWQSIGLRVKLIIIPPEQIKEIIKNRSFQAFLYGVLENFNLDPYPLWHSSQSDSPGFNLTGFSYRRSDELLEKATLTQDQEKKKEYYKEFQEIIADNIPAIFLYNTTYGYLVNQKIKGIKINRIAHPSDRFIDIEGWYIKTKRVWKRK